MSPSDSPVTLVQIVSSPHSGSTILGVVLGAAPGAYYGGEMDRIPNPVWKGGLQCSCGSPTVECAFWSGVRARFEATQSIPAFEGGQRAFEPWGAVPRTLAASFTGRRGLQAHAERTADFVDAVARGAGARFVVDSSKLAGRALVYGAVPPERLRVRFVHLVRDGRSVIASRKSRWATAGAATDSVGFASRMTRRWVVANLTFDALGRRRRDRYLRLRYEDLAADPEATLRRLERFLGLPLDGPLGQIREGSPFGVVHVPTGNRFRLGGEVRFQRSPVSRPPGITPDQARAFWRLAGSLARHYGYPRQAPAPTSPAAPASPSG